MAIEIEIPDPQDLAFDEPCKRCWGSGEKRVPSTLSRPEVVKMCHTCHGTGRSLTPVGRRLIEFLENLGVTIPRRGGVM